MSLVDTPQESVEKSQEAQSQLEDYCAVVEGKEQNVCPEVNKVKCLTKTKYHDLTAFQLQDSHMC